MVVPVLITNCQISEYLKAGPVAAQMITAISASPKAIGEPTHLVTCAAKWSKNREMGLARPAEAPPPEARPVRAARCGRLRSGRLRRAPSRAC